MICIGWINFSQGVIGGKGGDSWVEDSAMDKANELDGWGDSTFDWEGGICEEDGLERPAGLAKLIKMG